MYNSHLSSSISWFLELLSRHRALHSSLLIFTRFPSAHFFSLLRSFWMAALPSGVSATPPSSMLSAKLLRIHPDPSSKSLMKMLNRTVTSTDLIIYWFQADSVLLITTPWDQPFSHYLCSPSPHFNSLSMKILWKKLK